MNDVILITGAAGYIGPHFIETLIHDASWSEKKIQLVFLDDLSTGHVEMIDRLNELASEKGWRAPQFERISLLELEKLKQVMMKYRPAGVLHFAALISVAESVEKPDLYFKNNVEGSRNLLQAMREAGTRNLVFSSTAAVYGAVASGGDAITESTPLAPINPYGETKLKMEEALSDAAREWGLKSVIFRYFNAAGASPEGRFGEWHEPETHLIPLLLRAAMSGRPLKVFGADYDTRDGSCIRDYIHVTDLGRAHLMGLQKLLFDSEFTGSVFNLGTARGTSVFELIAAAERLLGKKVPFEVHSRRPGDASVLIADAKKAQQLLGWIPLHSEIDTILKHVMAWELKA